MAPFQSQTEFWVILFSSDKQFVYTVMEKEKKIVLHYYTIHIVNITAVSLDSLSFTVYFPCSSTQKEICEVLL